MLSPQSVAALSGECERRQAWCYLQVKLCDPCLSALRTKYLSSRALYKSTFLYLLPLLRSTYLCFSRSFDDVTRINFQYRILVMWSSPHGRDASSHKIWYTYLYPIQSYWHFFEIQDGRRRHLNLLGGAMGPPTKANSWCVVRTPV